MAVIYSRNVWICAGLSLITAFINLYISISPRIDKILVLSLKSLSFSGSLNSDKKEIFPMLLRSKCKIRLMADQKNNIAKSRNGLKNFIFDYDNIRGKS